MYTDKLILKLIEDYLEGKEPEHIDSEAIREYFIQKTASGHLFTKRFLYVFFLMQNKVIDKDDRIDLIKKKLENYFNFYRNKKEYLYINDTIFLLDILNNNFKDGLLTYCKRLFTFIDNNVLVSDGYDKFISFFLSKVDNKLILELLSNLLEGEFLLEVGYRKRIMLFSWFIILYNYSFNLSPVEKREVIYPLFKKVISFLIKNKLIKDLLFFHNIAYSVLIGIVQDLTADFQKIEAEISRPCREFYKQWIKEHLNLSPPKPKNKTSNEKIKVAIVRPTFSFWSPFKLEYSLAKSLLQDADFTSRCELYFYSISLLDFGTHQDESKCIEMLRDIGVEVRKPDERFLKQGIFVDRVKLILSFRKQLIDDGIDVLVYSDHLYSVGEFLLLTRAAPNQVYWCHMNHEVDNEGIDERIIHYPPPEDSKFKDDFQQFTLKLDDIFLKGDEEQFKKEAAQIRAKYPKGAIILGSIGRLIKVDNYDYLQTVAKIMQDNQDTIYLACGIGDVESIKRKLREVGIDEKRFYFPGWVDPKVYRYVIDVYLNTFPFHSGAVIGEFWAKDDYPFIVSLA